MLNRIRRMLIKEFLQMLRDPRMRVVIFGVPVIQMTVMAFALTTDVMNIRTAVLDMDKTPASRELISEFTGSNYFRIVHYALAEREFGDGVRSGERGKRASGESLPVPRAPHPSFRSRSRGDAGISRG